MDGLVGWFDSTPRVLFKAERQIENARSTFVIECFIVLPTIEASFSNWFHLQIIALTGLHP